MMNFRVKPPISSTKHGCSHKAWMYRRCVLSHKLSKFVTSVYHSHPHSVNKHVICAAFPRPPTHPFHWQHGGRIKPLGHSTVFLNAAFTLNKERRLKLLLAGFYEPRYFFFYPIPGRCCTFVLARMQWLCDRDDRGNYIAQKMYTEKRKQSCFSERRAEADRQWHWPQYRTVLLLWKKPAMGLILCHYKARLRCEILLFLSTAKSN